jgi:AcrR family transcriptional regulator
LQATIELLEETGDADAVSIRAVADRVGKTPPSIYLHFADKDDLLLSVCERAFVALGDSFAVALDGIDHPVERIAACARAYVHFAVDHPEQYRIVFMATRHLPAGEASMASLRENVAFAPLYRNIVAAFDQGFFVGSDPDTTALVMWASVHGMASLLITKPNFDWPDVDDFITAACQMKFDGLRPR